MVTSMRLVVPVQVLGEISLNCFSNGFAETLGQILSTSCFEAQKLTLRLAQGTPGAGDITSMCEHFSVSLSLF